MSEDQNITGEESTDSQPTTEENTKSPGEAQLQTETMEVHHHTHTPHKEFKHYLFEFFMLFLAVFAGFFAENQREEIVEHSREKEYIRSMIDDLTRDITEFSDENAARRTAVNMYDSVIILLNKKDRDQSEQQRMYYMARMSVRLSAFPVLNDRTYEQMKSSGNLRLIRDEAIADRITKYYFNSKEFSVNISQSVLRLQSLIDYQGKVFDGTVFGEMVNTENFSIKVPEGNPALISGDKKIINELITRIHYVLSIILYSENFINQLKMEATQLIEILKKGYHLN